MKSVVTFVGVDTLNKENACHLVNYRLRVTANLAKQHRTVGKVFTSDAVFNKNFKAVNTIDNLNMQETEKNVYIAIMKTLETSDEVYVVCDPVNAPKYERLASYISENTGKKVHVY